MGGIVMAATISANSAGGGGLVSSGDASGVLQLQTAGVTGLTIDASQKVTFANSLTSPTLVTPTLTTPTIDSASVPTVSGTAPLYMCRAWVNFNGTGTVAIRASGNVSSITDNGTGDYTVNFTTAMADANYATGTNYGNTAGSVVTKLSDATVPTITAVRVITLSSSAFGAIDVAQVHVSIFR
jgi:hypothetical protein